LLLCDLRQLQNPPTISHSAERDDAIVRFSGDRCSIGSVNFIKLAMNLCPTGRFLSALAIEAFNARLGRMAANTG
jgi:hypothetical protein